MSGPKREEQEPLMREQERFMNALDVWAPQPVTNPEETVLTEVVTVPRKKEGYSGVIKHWDPVDALIRARLNVLAHEYRILDHEKDDCSVTPDQRLSAFRRLLRTDGKSTIGTYPQ
jgi:hypothetical protein